jgi:hypothetical protein
MFLLLGRLFWNERLSLCTCASVRSSISFAWMAYKQRCPVDTSPPSNLMPLGFFNRDDAVSARVCLSFCLRVSQCIFVCFCRQAGRQAGRHAVTMFHVTGTCINVRCLIRKSRIRNVPDTRRPGGVPEAPQRLPINVALSVSSKKALIGFS